MFEPLRRTTQKIRDRGYLIAGVSKGIYGLSYREAGGRWQGFDTDLARAVAVAVLGDSEAIEFVPVAPDERCAAVASGLVDIGTFNASATLGREVRHDVARADDPPGLEGEQLGIAGADAHAEQMAGRDGRRPGRRFGHRHCSVTLARALTAATAIALPPRRPCRVR